MASSNKNHPTICLNMIVKNESRVIERVLNSVVNLIDTYCIEDTGSTDNTIEIITKFFFEKGIIGKIVKEPFRNFAYNRSHSLKQAKGMSDYLLFIDADMILTYSLDPDDIRKRLLQNDVFYVFQGSDRFYYKNVRFAKNNPESRYVTPTHEYFEPPKRSTYGGFEKSEIFINDIGDGGSKHNKGLRDIRLLTEELSLIGDKGKGADRCVYYLANSYRDVGNVELAIQFYKKRVDFGGWMEEVWQSLYSIGNLYQGSNEMEQAVFYWLKAYEAHPARIENLYKIVEYYRNTEKYKTAHLFWQVANKIKNQASNLGDFLFLESDVYDYLLDYEYSILGYYNNCDSMELSKAVMNVISNHSVSDWMYDNCLKNYCFYVPKLISSHNRGFSFENNLELLRSIGKKLMKESLDNNEFYSSTPSIAFLDDKTLVVCVRYVNYVIGKNGEYINKDNIITKNIIAIIDITEDSNWVLKKKEKELIYDDSRDNLYIGLEDIRLFSYMADNKVELCYNANRGLDYNTVAVEKGGIDINTVSTVNSEILTFNDNQNKVEKNWVLFHDGKSVKCVYGWGPLIIGTIDSNHVFNQIEQKNDENVKLPKFFQKVRGSSNGVTIEGTNEIWFLCHYVIYENGHRVYYHLFIVLDKDTYKVLKYTRLFTFCKENVEYSTGMVYFKETNEFLIGYSIMDRTSDYTILSKNELDKLMV